MKWFKIARFDEGGVLPITQTSPQSRNYITSLRFYNKSSCGSRPMIPDFFQESQHALPFKDYLRVSQTFQSQKKLIKRLLVLPAHKLPFIREKNEKKETILPKLK